MAFGEEGLPHRFDHEDGDGGNLRADPWFRGHIGLRRDLAELAFRMGLGVLMRMGRPLIAENPEQIHEESRQQQPAGPHREMAQASHTWGGI